MMLCITTMNLSGVDLNLFLVLHAVLEERGATAAAKRLHVTQSAVSNSLARLRDLLGDPLFVREGRGLVPTPRAQELAPLVATIVGQLKLAVESSRGFDPATTQRTFTLCVADSHQTCDVPRVAETLARRMPGAKLRVVSPDFLIATDGLAAGLIDAAFFPEQAVQPGLRSHVLFEEHAKLVVRRGHPSVRSKITRDQFNALPHIDVQIALGNPGAAHGVVERFWKQHGLKREISLVVPSFVTAAMAAARTDCIAGLPDRVATLFASLLPLEIVAAAFPLPSVITVLVWHERTHADPGARMFRELIVESVAEPPVSSYRSTPAARGSRRGRARRARRPG